MTRFRHRLPTGIYFGLIVFWVSGFALIAKSAPASIIVDAYYRLGEDDPGATNGGSGQNPTQANVGANDLAKTGTASYSSSVAGGAAAATGSTLAMDFSGNASYSIANSLGSPVDNWGIEAWFNVDTAATGVTQVIVNHGDFNVAGNSVYLYVSATGNIAWSIDGISGSEYGAATAGVWHYVAIARMGSNLDLYYDSSTPAATYPVAIGQTVPVNAFAIGDYATVYDRKFSGLIDEVRLFHFNEGEFSSTDLLINQVAAPEPSSAWILLGTLGWLPNLRRRVRAKTNSMHGC